MFGQEVNKRAYLRLFWRATTTTRSRSVAVALTNDHAKHDEYVQVSSGLLLLYGIGAVAGPFLAALLMGAVEPGGLYVFSADDINDGLPSPT